MEGSPKRQEILKPSADPDVSSGGNTDRLELGEREPGLKYGGCSLYGGRSTVTNRPCATQDHSTKDYQEQLVRLQSWY